MTQSAIVLLVAAIVHAQMPAVAFRVAANAELGDDDFRISDMGADKDLATAARNADVAYNATNHEYLVVWDGTDTQGEFEIYGQFIDAETMTEIGTDFRISVMGPDGDNKYAAFTPAVVWNSVNNEYLVVWRGDDNTSPLVDNENEVFVQRIDGATRTEIGTDTRISDMGPNGNTTYAGQEPAIAHDPDLNQYLVVWRGDDDSVGEGKWEIWGQLLNGSAAEIGTNDFRISVTPGDDTRIPTAPHVAYNSTDREYLVVWHSDALTVDNDMEIFGQRIDALTGAKVGTSPFRISDMGPEDDAGFRGVNPRVAYNPIANEYLVIWLGHDTGVSGVFKFDVYGERLAGATGERVGTNDFRISDMGPESDTNFNAGKADVAWSPAENRYLVTWHGDDTVDGEDEIYAQRLDASGAEVGENDFRLSTMGPDGDVNYDAFFPRVAYGSNGVALVVWEGDDNTDPLVDQEREIFGQFVGGFPAGSTTTITANPTSIPADGVSTTTITVQAKDVSGANVTTGAAAVTLATSRGTLGGITDHDNGTYTATLTSSTTAGTATITGTIDGTAITDTATVTFTFEKPANVAATATSTTAVSVTWTAVSGATSYDVYRATQVPGYSFRASPTTNSYTDSPVSAGQTYVYIVRAVTNDGTSGFSDPDAATTIIFTDPTLNSSVLVKAIHLAQIRQAVNAMRAAAGLDAATFSPATAGTIIQRAHIVEARDALDEARTAIGLPGIGYTDPIITAGATTVKAAHFTGLRQGTQ